MDEHEYWERFRLAILWDEFRRREFPEIKGPVNLSWSHSKRERDAHRSRIRKCLYRKHKRESIFDWEGIFMTVTNVDFYARMAMQDCRGWDCIGSLRLTVWSLRHQIEDIRDPDVHEYLEHLIFVAEETLKVLDNQ